MADPRRGLNSKLSYVWSGTTHAFSVRTSAVKHGIQPIYTESEARVRKVYYPHRVSLSQFSIDVELLNEAEYIQLSTWLANYVDKALDTAADTYDQFPYMLVFIPSRNFYRRGVPVSGFQWGDKVGKVDWGFTVAFETVDDFGVDGLQHVVNDSQSSQVTGKALTDITTKYFYPSGIQLTGSNAPPDGTYAVPISVLDVTGGTDAGSSGGGTGVTAPPSHTGGPVDTGPTPILPY